MMTKFISTPHLLKRDESVQLVLLRGRRRSGSMPPIASWDLHPQLYTMRQGDRLEFGRVHRAPSASSASASSSSNPLENSLTVPSIAVRTHRRTPSGALRESFEETTKKLVSARGRSAVSRALSSVDSTSYDEDGSVLSGSQSNLVNLLASEQPQDLVYVDEFLSTFRYFMSGEELVQRLAKRFHFEFGDGSESSKGKESADEDWELWRGAVRLRVVNVLKKWIELPFYAFEEDPAAQAALMEFIQTRLMGTDSEPWGKMLKNYVEGHLPWRIAQKNMRVPMDMVVYSMRNGDIPTIKKGKGRVVDEGTTIDWMRIRLGVRSPENCQAILRRLCSQKYLELGASSTGKLHYTFLMEFPSKEVKDLYPKSHAEKSVGSKDSFEFVHLDPLEMARQLTLIEQSFIARLSTQELVGVEKDPKPKNLQEMIDWSNKLAKWVASEIVLNANAKKRLSVVKQFILLLNHLRKLKNFNSMSSITMGLEHRSVSRLKGTWETLPKKYKQMREECFQLISVSSNFKALRDCEHLDPPLIPYFPLILKDATVIEITNDTHLKDSKLINFVKMRMLYEQQKRVRRVQDHAYHFLPIISIQNWLRRAVVLSDEELDKYSRLAEPPNTD